MSNRRRNIMLRMLGVALTLAVIALDAADLLAPLERWAYDKRAALFQDFSPPPTTELVHVDIDDGALEAIGYWPWPRSTLADIVEELHRAGAKAVALDVVFSELQSQQQDARFAEAIRNAGNVLVPTSFELDTPAVASPAQRGVTELLRTDLELGWDVVSARLREAYPDLTESQYLAGRAEAINHRVARERGRGCRTLDELKRRVLPRT